MPGTTYEPGGTFRIKTEHSEVEVAIRRTGGAARVVHSGGDVTIEIPRGLTGSALERTVVDQLRAAAEPTREHGATGDGEATSQRDAKTVDPDRGKAVGIENRGAPYQDPRENPNLPHEHLERRHLRPYKKMEAVSSWRDAEMVLRKDAHSVAIGKKLRTAEEGHAILQRLATGDATALAAVGIGDVPSTMNSSLREWALVQGRDGFVIYAGQYGAVMLPSDVRVLAHNHPGPHHGQLSEGRMIKDIPNAENGRDYADILADMEAATDAGIIPSIADIHAISGGSSHVIYTRYVTKGNGKIGNPTPGTSEPRVSLHLDDTKVLRWNERSLEYWYEVSMTVKDSSWSGRLYGRWGATTQMGTVFASKPLFLQLPPTAGWRDH